MLVGLLALTAAGASVNGAAPTAPPELVYRLDVRLNEKEHVLTGRESIRYVSHAAVPLTEFYLHLYPNRYRDQFSTAARERAFYHDYTIADIKPADRGYLDVESLTVNGKATSFKLVDTVLAIELAEPLAPGQVLDLDLEFFEKIPKHIDLMGWEGRHYDMAQWYPKVAVYDEHGWHADQYHDLGEFYGEFASYEVTLTVPRDFVVAATGALVAGDAGWQGTTPLASQAQPPSKEQARRQGYAVEEVGEGTTTKTVSFAAERVHDFAWVGDPDFVVEEGRTRDTAVRAFFRKKDRDKWSGVAVERGVRILDWLGERFAPYPYAQISIVQGLLEGGMEYPQLAMVGSEREALICHELAQNYLYGILANNEIDEPWLDEGFSAFMTRWYMSSRYGDEGVNPDDLSWYERRLDRTTARDAAEIQVLERARPRLDEPVATVAYRFRDRPNYRTMSYAKASLMFDMLRSVLGEESFARGLKLYYDRYQFQHVDEAGLRSVFEEVAGRELGWFFDEWLHSTATCDYRLRGVKVTRADDGYRIEVTATRNDAIVMPVALLIETASGEKVSESWDGKAARHVWSVKTHDKPTRVWLDPDNQILDKDVLNNRWPRSFEFMLQRPFQDYRRRDAVVLAYRPSAWYNAVDRLRFGAVLEGSQEGWLHRVKAAGSLGSANGRFDGIISYTQPVNGLGRATFHIEATKQEGRRSGEAKITWNLSPRLERRPQSIFEASFSSIDLQEPAYVVPGEFQKGVSNKVSLTYRGLYAGHGWDSNAGVTYDMAGATLGSRFSFGKLAAWWAVHATPGKFRLGMRTFVGLSPDSSNLPLHERFYLGNANPLVQYAEPGLRSRDSLLRLLNYHIPGDGNIRAYATHTVSARRLGTMNLEAEHDLPLPTRWMEKKLFAFSGALFADLGQADSTGDTRNDHGIVSTGLGLRFRRSLLGKAFLVRLDFPFYVNRPPYGDSGEREGGAQYRWLLSFVPAF